MVPIQHPKGSLDTHTHTHTHTHTQENAIRHRDTLRRWSWSHGVSSQETPKMGGRLQQLGEKHRKFSPSLSRDYHLVIESGGKWKGFQIKSIPGMKVYLKGFRFVGT